MILGVTESSQVFPARRAALDLADSLGWDETLSGRLAIAVTEIATNLVKHAKAGELHIRQCERRGVAGIELLALDRGPGLAEPGASLRDGYSTSGTAGTGLGAIRRLSSEFDIYSQAGKGTTVVARFYPDAPRPSTDDSGAELLVGAVQVPIAGESVCGDDWGIRKYREKTVLLLADGLGHGPGAAQASREAVDVLKRDGGLDPVNLLESVHRALRPTRGAAIAIASVDTMESRVEFAGIGNISAIIQNGSGIQHLVSHNGTAGQAARTIRGFTYPWPSRGLLIMHSDGLHTNWRLDAYPGLTEKHPSLIAAVLYRDASRRRDDVCVVVARGCGNLNARE